MATFYKGVEAGFGLAGDSLGLGSVSQYFELGKSNFTCKSQDLFDLTVFTVEIQLNCNGYFPAVVNHRANSIFARLQACNDNVCHNIMAAKPKILVPTPSEKSLKQLFSTLTDLYLTHRTKISRTVYITLSLALINRVRNAISEQNTASLHQEQIRQRPATVSADGHAHTRNRVELNREFVRNLLRLLRIVIPGWRSKELGLLMSHSVFLVLRTLLSLYVAELDGKLVSSLVQGKGKRFLRNVVWWMIVAVPATFTNSMVN